MVVTTPHSAPYGYFRRTSIRSLAYTNDSPGWCDEKKPGAQYRADIMRLAAVLLINFPHFLIRAGLTYGAVDNGSQ